MPAEERYKANYFVNIKDLRNLDYSFIHSDIIYNDIALEWYKVL